MKAKLNLSPKQEKVLHFIREKIEGGIPPTIREIAQELRFSSTGTVRDYLKILENKGYLRRFNKKSRAIELLKGNPARIPIISTIFAGKPNLAYEDIQGYITPDDLLRLKGRREVFALRVKGDSMLEAGIIEGDIAIIHKQPIANNRDIVAALLDNNEVTLKMLRRKGNTYFLEAANKNYPSIHKSFTIIGKLVTIVRKYV